MSRRLMRLLLALAVVLTACSKSTDSKTGELTKIRLPMGGMPGVQYAPFYEALDKGYYESAGLDVRFEYLSEAESLALVSANKAPFALLSAEQALLARAEEQPVVYVASWWHDHPAVVATGTGSGILEPADLRGKKIGLPGLFGASYAGLSALLEAAGIPIEDASLEAIGFNPAEALMSGREDAVVINASEQTSLQEALDYDVRLFPVREYASLPSTGIVANQQTIDENPELVRRFVAATLMGLQDSIVDTNEAFGITKKFLTDMNDDQNLTQWKMLNTTVDYWKAKRLGISDPEAWERLQNTLLKLGMLKAPIDLGSVYTNDFIP